MFLGEFVETIFFVNNYIGVIWGFWPTPELAIVSQTGMGAYFA